MCAQIGFDGFIELREYAVAAASAVIGAELGSGALAHAATSKQVQQIVWRGA
jgi:hypothetical protein